MGVHDRSGIVVATHVHDMAVYDANVFRKCDRSEQRVDVHERHAVFAVDDQAGYLNTFDYLGERLQRLQE